MLVNNKRFIEYKLNPAYKLNYVGDNVLFVLSNQVAKIDKEGNWYDISFHIPSSSKNIYPLYIDKNVGINLNGDFILLESSSKGWQTELMNNKELAKNEKALFLLFLDLYIKQEKRELSLYKELLTFSNTGNVLNDKISSEKVFY